MVGNLWMPDIVNLNLLGMRISGFLQIFLSFVMLLGNSLILSGFPFMLDGCAAVLMPELSIPHFSALHTVPRNMNDGFLPSGWGQQALFLALCEC